MNKKYELRQLDKEQLQEKIKLLRSNMFEIKLKSVTSPIKDYSQFKKIRREIARSLTYLRQKI